MKRGHLSENQDCVVSATTCSMINHSCVAEWHLAGSGRSGGPAKPTEASRRGLGRQGQSRAEASGAAGHGHWTAGHGRPGRAGGFTLDRSRDRPTGAGLGPALPAGTARYCLTGPGREGTSITVAVTASVWSGPNGETPKSAANMACKREGNGQHLSRRGEGIIANCVSPKHVSQWSPL